MKIKIKKSVLMVALKKSIGTVSQQDAAPILKNFMLEATRTPSKSGTSDTWFRVYATDLSLSILAEIENIVEVIEDGRATVPAKKFLDYVSELDEGDVEISFEGDTLVVKAGSNVTHFKGMDPATYPPLPKFEGDSAVKVDREELQNALGRVAYAISEDDTRKNLLMVHFEGGKLYATNSHRLAVSDLNMVSEKVDFPKGAVLELLKILPLSGSKDVFIHSTPQHIMFKVGSDIMSARVAEDKFPDVIERVVNPAKKNSDLYVEVDRDILAHIVKRVSVSSDDKTYCVALSFEPGVMKISARDMLGNSSTETVPVFWQGAKVEKGFNHEYVTTMLSMLKEKNVKLQFSSTDSETKRSPLMVVEPGYEVYILQTRLMQ